MSLTEANRYLVEGDRNKEVEGFVIERIVIKIGTSTLKGEEEDLDIPFMNRIAYQASELFKAGIEVLIVTSGAVEKGKSVLEMLKNDDEIRNKQVAALYGQPDLISEWSSLFKKWGIHNVGQLLITDENLPDAKGVLKDALPLGIIIANANDAISRKEMEQLRIDEDNDTLAGFLRETVDADTILFLTSTNGVENINGDTIPEIVYSKEIEEKVVFDGKSDSGTGGMESKHRVALEQARLGARVIIANGREKNVILRVALGENPGTEYLTET